MVTSADENKDRLRRMEQCRRECWRLLKETIDAGTATPVEAASSMMSAAITAAFVAAGCEARDVASVNACVTEVAELVRRRVGEWRAQGGGE